jgi:hypothetical protein
MYLRPPIQNDEMLLFKKILRTAQRSFKGWKITSKLVDALPHFEGIKLPYKITELSAYTLQ